MEGLDIHKCSCLAPEPFLSDHVAIGCCPLLDTIMAIAQEPVSLTSMLESEAEKTAQISLEFVTSAAEVPALENKAPTANGIDAIDPGANESNDNDDDQAGSGGNTTRKPKKYKECTNERSQ